MMLVQVVQGGLWEPFSKQNISSFLFQHMVKALERRLISSERIIHGA